MINMKKMLLSYIIIFLIISATIISIPTNKGDKLYVDLNIKGINDPTHIVKNNTFGEYNFTFLGLEGKSITSLIVVEDYLIVGSNHGIFRKNLKESNSEWKYLGLKKVKSIYCNPNNPKIIYVGLEKKFLRFTHTLYKGFNSGKIWIPSDIGLFDFRQISRLPINSICGDPNDPKVLYASSILSIFKSNNGGISWKLIQGDKGMFAPGTHIVTVDPSDSNIIWYGGENALLHPFMGKSVDKGSTWKSIETYTGGDNAVYNIVVNSKNSSIVYAGMEGQLIKTINGGDNWSIILAPEEGPYFKGLTLDPDNPDHIFAGQGPSAGGGGNYPLVLWESFDGGNTWKKHVEENSNDEDRVICLNFDNSGTQKNVYIGTYSGGVWAYSYQD